MGRQSCIRVTGEDLDLLEAECRARDAAFVAYYQPCDGPLRVAGSLKQGFVRDPIIWLTRAQDLAGIRTHAVANQQYCLVDQTSQPIIELSLGIGVVRDPKKGRLYFRNAQQRRDAGGWSDERFDRWAGGILQWVRHRFSYDRVGRCYDGPGVAKEIRWGERRNA